MAPLENPDESLPESSPQDIVPTSRMTQTIPTLPQLGILAGLSDRSLLNLAGYGRCHRSPVGSEIMREGEMQDRFYVIVTGELAITSQTNGQEVTLNVCKAGECIGELNLLEPGPASATVRVSKDATLWSIDIEELRPFIFEHTSGAGAFLLGMAVCMSDRIRHSNQIIAQNHVPPIETLPAGRERAITADNAPVHLGFFERIKQSLAGNKKICISTKIKM